MSKEDFLKWANDNPLDFEFFWHDFLFTAVCEAWECGDYFNLSPENTKEGD